MKIDIELVEKVKSGDKAAFSQLYDFSPASAAALP